MRDVTGGPARLVLTASVARRYYLDGRSKIEIAEEYGLSRFKVARLIESARSSGLVRIEIAHPGGIDVDLSARLEQELGLRHAIVVDTSDDDVGALRKALGIAAADLLQEIVTPDDVLGVAWARSVSAMASALGRLPAVPVVQLTGALTRLDAADSSVDVARVTARAAGGPVFFFYAPLMVQDATTARALRQQPEVAHAMERLGSVTKAVVGVGCWAPGRSTVYDAATEAERERLRRDGVQAEVAGVFLDADGNPLRGTSERMIGIDAAQLRAVPEVLGLAYGAEKAAAVRAAVRGGVLDGLVTHTALARELLA